MKLEHKTHWIVFLIGILTAVTLVWTAYEQSKKGFVDTFNKQIPAEFKTFQKHLKVLYNDKKTLLTMLTEHPDVQSYCMQSGTMSRAKIEELFFQQVKGSDVIMQLRFLDVSGQERVRVDRKNGQIEIIPDSELQDKSKRDYFQAFVQLQQGEIGFSKLDLNVENGQVEIPYKPTLRTAMPVFDDKGLQGIIIINFAMERWLKKVADTAFINLYLVDERGSFILHPEASMRWSGYRETPVTASQVFDIPFDTATEDKLRSHKKLFYTRVRLWDSHEYILIFEPKADSFTELLGQTTLIGLLLVMAIASLLLPFGKLIYEYIVNLESAKAKTARSEKYLQTLFDNTVDAIVVINRDGIIERINRVTCRMFGYEIHELIGAKVNVLVPEPHHSLHDSYIRAHDPNIDMKVLGRERGLYGRHKEGTLIPVTLVITKMHFDNETRFVGILRDVSSEKLSEQLFEKVFDKAPLGIALVLPDGSFWRANRGFCDIIGYSEEEVRHITFQEITHPDDLQGDLDTTTSSNSMRVNAFFRMAGFRTYTH